MISKELELLDLVKYAANGDYQSACIEKVKEISTIHFKNTGLDKEDIIFLSNKIQEQIHDFCKKKSIDKFDFQIFIY